jgi:hypothetical protein
MSQAQISWNNNLKSRFERIGANKHNQENIEFSFDILEIIIGDLIHDGVFSESQLIETMPNTSIIQDDNIMNVMSFMQTRTSNMNFFLESSISSARASDDLLHLFGHFKVPVKQTCIALQFLIITVVSSLAIALLFLYVNGVISRITF